MESDTVIELLQALQASGIDSWVDGGWGVDALLGRQTRPHEDLDLVIALDHVPRIREVLGARGFTLAEDQLPIRFVLSHPQLGHMDFHTVTFDDSGGGLQPQPNGKVFRYPLEGFVRGRIAGQPVRCISAEVQVLCHLGYEPKEKDIRDVLSLHHALGVPLPASYHLPYTRLTAPTLDRLAALGPRTLATMHGSVLRGDGAKALRDLGQVYAEVLG
jgi:lincosamide nucleotidyltransferase A/C/D/E